jgi:hypothetical protein
MEYLTEFASLYPIPDVATAFVIYAEDPRFYTIVNKHGLLRTMDAVIKNKVRALITFRRLFSMAT